MVLEIENLNDLPATVSKFLDVVKNNKHFALFGPMGVGKTTFIKEVCRQLHISEVVTSPTFSLVNEYALNDGKKFYHFDFYRIKDQTELYDIGFEDYAYSDNYCFIEWPEKAMEIIPTHFRRMILEETSSGRRKIEIDLE